MASITSLTAAPSTVTKGGGTTKIVPTISNPDGTATVTVALDGKTGTAQVTLHEPLTFSVNPADIGKLGYVVATVDQGGTLAVGSDGQSFTFTAS